MAALFPVGRVMAEPRVLDEIGAGAEPGVSPNAAALEYLTRHQYGDFGDVSWTDAQANREAVPTGGEIVSEYVLATGSRLRISTETTTTLTLAEEG